MGATEHARSNIVSDGGLGGNGIEQLAELLAGDIEQLESTSFSASSMAVRLKAEIRTALGRGVSYRQIAVAFTARGLRAEPDTIRIAINRHVVTKAARARKSKQTTTSQRGVGPRELVDSHGTDAPKAEAASGFGNHRRGPNLAPRLK